MILLLQSYNFIMEPEKQKNTEPVQLKKKQKNKGWDDPSFDPQPLPSQSAPPAVFLPEQPPTNYGSISSNPPPKK